MKSNRWNNLLFLQVIHNHLFSYPTPANINYLWSFGSLSGIFFAFQFISGLFLSMHYVPEVQQAFFSVEHIMRDVNFGWFARYLHSNGASMFFIVIFLHIFRNLYYCSYTTPRVFLWVSGIIIFFLLMAIAFMGYVLPWGQMSFWGATVITNLFSAVPLYGISIVEWLWGGFSVDQATLNRFFSFHFFLPFILALFIFIHLILLHQAGSSDPLALDSNKNNKQPVNLNFFPYFFVKDLYCILIGALITHLLIFYNPNLLGHPDNYINADSMVTPAHIVPEWYFLPFYAILRSIPNKLGGVVAMGFAIISLGFLPFLILYFRAPEFKPLFVYALWGFVINFCLLGWIGQLPVEEPFSTAGAYCTFFYFCFIFIFFPLTAYIENYLIEENFFFKNFFKNSIF